MIIDRGMCFGFAEVIIALTIERNKVHSSIAQCGQLVTTYQ